MLVAVLLLEVLVAVVEVLVAVVVVVVVLALLVLVALALLSLLFLLLLTPTRPPPKQWKDKAKQLSVQRTAHEVSKRWFDKLQVGALALQKKGRAGRGSPGSSAKKRKAPSPNTTEKRTFQERAEFTRAGDGSDLILQKGTRIAYQFFGAQEYNGGRAEWKFGRMMGKPHPKVLFT